MHIFHLHQGSFVRNRPRDVGRGRRRHPAADVRHGDSSGLGPGGVAWDGRVYEVHPCWYVWRVLLSRLTSSSQQGLCCSAEGRLIESFQQAFLSWFFSYYFNYGYKFSDSFFHLLYKLTFFLEWPVKGMETRWGSKYPRTLPYCGTWWKRKTRKTTLHRLHDTFLSLMSFFFTMFRIRVSLV